MSDPVVNQILAQQGIHREAQQLMANSPYSTEDQGQGLWEQFWKSAAVEASFGLARPYLEVDDPETMKEKIVQGIGTAAGFGVPLLIPGTAAVKGAGLAARALGYGVKGAKAGTNIGKIIANPLSRRMLKEGIRAGAASASIAPEGGVFDGGTWKDEIKGRITRATIDGVTGSALGAVAGIPSLPKRVLAGGSLTGGTVALLGGDTEDIAFAFGLGLAGSVIPAEKGDYTFTLKERTSKSAFLKDSPDAQKTFGHIGFDDAGQRAGNLSPGEKIYSALVSRTYVIEKLAKIFGTRKPIEMVGQAAATPGHAYNAITKYGIWDRNGKQISKPLKQIVASAGDEDGLRTIIASYRDLELTARNVETGFDHAASRANIARAEKNFPQLIEAHKQWKVHQAGKRQLMRESGRYSDDMLDALDEAQNYAAFYRVMPGGEHMDFATSKGLKPKEVLKKQKGSKLMVKDPIENEIKNFFMLNDMLSKQKVFSSIIEAAEGNPQLAKKWLIKQDTFKKTKALSDADMDVILENNGVDGYGTLSTDAKRVIVEMIEDRSLADTQNVIAHTVNGEKSYYQLDPDLNKALDGLNEQTAGIFTKMLAVPARYLRAGATVLSPEFAGRNIIRDTMHSFVVSRHSKIPGETFVRGIYDMMTGGKGRKQWFDQSGGSFANMVTPDRKFIAETMGKAKNGAKIRTVLNPLVAMQRLSEAMENINRRGEFSLSFQKALKEGMPFEDAMRRAGYDARDLIDYSRMGSQIKSLNMMTAFLNAQIQGVDKLARAFKENPGATATKATLGITIPSMMLYMHNRKDPEYWELPQWERDIFWMFKVGEQWMRIPKPFEIGFAFGTMPEKIAASVMGDDEHAFDEAAKGARRAFIPTPIPTAVTPIIESFANRSLFTGRPIVPESQKNLPPELQKTIYTSEAAEALGDMFNYSPSKVDNFIGGYTAGFGKTITREWDRLVRMGEPVRELSDMPFVRGFASRRVSGGENMHRFYETRNTILARSAAFKRTGDPQYAIPSEQKKFTDKIAKSLSTLRKRREAIYTAKGMSPQDKRKELTRLADEMTRISNLSMEVIKKWDID
jgi:hypothetical protein